MGVLRLSRLVAHTVVVRLTSIRLFIFMEHRVMSMGHSEVALEAWGRLFKSRLTLTQG